MQQGARVQAAIELLDDLHASNSSKGPALEDLIRAYFRKRRYAGSGDRRTVREMVYAVVRQWGMARYIAEHFQLAPSGRSWMIAHTAIHDIGLLDLFGAGGHAPEALSEAEKAAAAQAPEALASAPLWAQANVPQDLYDLLQARYAGDTDTVFDGLDGRAPLTLRVNAAKTSRALLLPALMGSGMEAQVTTYAPAGFSVPVDTALSALPGADQGMFEVQDEASQLAALMVQPLRDGRVVDVCAGAGGKSLAIAATHPGAHIIACDVSQPKLDELSKRAERAGAQIETRLLPETFPGDLGPLADMVGKADAVLVDAPCSSSGTWRRRPDARWRYGAEDVAGFAALQASLVKTAWQLLAPGGQLVFATCSLFPAEGEGVMAQSLDALQSAQPLPYADLLRNGGVREVPETLSKSPDWLMTAPHTHGCDGFFAASLRK